MLFLGTEDYPGENEYSSFLSKQGGDDNAYTGASSRPSSVPRVRLDGIAVASSSWTRIVPPPVS